MMILHFNYVGNQIKNEKNFHKFLKNKDIKILIYPKLLINKIKIIQKSV